MTVAERLLDGTLLLWVSYLQTWIQTVFCFLYNKGKVFAVCLIEFARQNRTNETVLKVQTPPIWHSRQAQSTPQSI
jgi:hypothetical protein